MAQTILIKFSGFKVYSKPNNLRLSAFPGKFPEARKIYYKVLRVLLPEAAILATREMFYNLKVNRDRKLLIIKTGPVLLK